jgi:hypothetical protein
VFSLTLLRVLPVGLALLGTRFRWPSFTFIGWFDPRGLASVVFPIIGIDGLAAAGIDASDVDDVVELVNGIAQMPIHYADDRDASWCARSAAGRRGAARHAWRPR